MKWQAEAESGDLPAAEECMAESFAGVLPARVVSNCLRIREFESELLGTEKCHIANAVKKRRAEFATGRVCARRALGRLGFPPFEIPAGPGRAPVWPESLIGSISHDGEYGVAAVGRKKDLSGLGIDLARRRPLNDRLVELICTPADLRQVAAFADDAAPDVYTLIFSIKEAVFKCLFPVAKRYFDFQAVSLRLDLARQCAEIEIIDRQLSQDFGGRLQSQFCWHAEYVFSAVWHRQWLLKV